MAPVQDTRTHTHKERGRQRNFVKLPKGNENFIFNIYVSRHLPDVSDLTG